MKPPSPSFLTMEEMRERTSPYSYKQNKRLSLDVEEIEREYEMKEKNKGQMSKIKQVEKISRNMQEDESNQNKGGKLLIARGTADEELQINGGNEEENSTTQKKGEDYMKERDRDFMAHSWSFPQSISFPLILNNF